MYLDVNPEFSIVNEGTRFSATIFFTNVTTDGICEAIVMCSLSVYTGFLHFIMAEEREQFREVFREGSDSLMFRCKKTFVSSQNC